MTFKTRRLKEEKAPPRWLTTATRFLSLAVRLHKPMLAWYQDYKKRDIERKKEEKRFRILKKILMILLGVLVVLLIVAAVVKTLVSAHILTIGNVFSVAGKELPVDENGFTNILLMGRESAGVPEAVANHADVKLRIPMAPNTRSLNVAQAATIVLSEALRQTESFPKS